jgi:hypothetical protein
MRPFFARPFFARLEARRRGWRARAPFVVGVVLLGLLAPILQACESVPGPISIKIADPSPRADNAQTFNYAGYQSISGRVISLAASRDGARVYAGTLRGGLWRSDDGGANWQQITGAQPGDNTRGCVDADPRCSLPSATVTDVVLAPDNPDIVIAAIAHDGAGQALNGVYRSDNGGKSWARVFQFSCEGYAQPVTQLQVAPDDNKRLYAAGVCGVAISPAHSGDAVGATWTLTQMPSSGRVYHVAAGPAQGAARTVYACGGANIYVSFDGGGAFAKDTSASDALPGDACPFPSYTGARSGSSAGLALAPGHPEQVYLTALTGGVGPTYFADGRLNGAPCDQATGACGGVLWLGDYTGASSSALKSAWKQLPSPPTYIDGLSSARGGAVGVRTVATGSTGYLVLFNDGNTVHVASGVPSTDRWSRLDGPNASVLARSGTALTPEAALPSQPLHIDPLATLATPDFALTLAPGVADRPAYAHNTELAECKGGTLWLASAGGVYRTADCGKTWKQSLNLESLSAIMLAGLPRPKSAHPYKLPAVYFGSTDNHDWYSMDGGLHWRGGDDLCVDCAGYWSDPARGDLVVHPVLAEGLSVYTGLNGDAPDLYDARQLTNAGFPLTLGVSQDGRSTQQGASAYLLAVTDWQAGTRPLVLSVPGQAARPPVDLALVAPVAPPSVEPEAGASVDLAVWRKQTLVAGTDGWTRDGAVLPAGATILQAAGGHTNPTYYAGDRVTRANGSLFELAEQGKRLYRSHRTADGTLDGWDCIVPGPAHQGAHDGQCATAATSAAGQAWAFVSDPYDANIVYILDSDGVKLTTDGGATWRRVDTLSDWLFEGGRIGPDCAVFCDDRATAVRALTSMEFVPDEPQMRFATGEAGVFFTNVGVSGNGKDEAWHRLLDTTALNCLPNSSYFDKTNTAGRALYLACAGRSLISFVGIPTPGQALNYTLDGGGQYPYPPILTQPNGTPTATPHAGQTPVPTIPVTPTPSYSVDFRVVPSTDYTQSCATGLKQMTFKLDNTRSGGAVDWGLAIHDADPSGSVWASANPTSGRIASGEIGVLTLTPGASVCSSMSAQSVQAKTYTAVLTYSGGKQVILSDTVTLK